MASKGPPGAAVVAASESDSPINSSRLLMRLESASVVGARVVVPKIKSLMPSNIPDCLVVVVGVVVSLFNQPKILSSVLLAGRASEPWSKRSRRMLGMTTAAILLKGCEFTGNVSWPRLPHYLI